MAFRKIAVNADRVESNALSGFGDMEAATLVGAAAAASTVGGAALIGTMVAPAQVFSGLALAGTAVGLGQVKANTGSYLPFLRKVDPTVDEAMTAKEQADEVIA